MNLARRLWRDEAGNATVTSLMLLVVIVAFGAVVGLVTFRDQIVQEFGDLATAIDSVDQSFSAGSLGSYADPGPTFTDPLDAEPACLSVTQPAGNETP
jgi:Flp pilus assembly pilin Flp